MNSFAEMAQPGVSCTQQIIDISRREKPTALPVFIGYSDAENIQGELTAVSSLQEFYHLFGQSPSGSGYLLDAMRLYFAHGGGRCHVLALAPGDDGPAAQDYDGITDIIANEPDITLLVLPDIVLLEPASWQQVVSGVGQCCAENLNLFALIDYPSAPQDAQACRQLDIGPYGMHMAGYWPWVIFEEDAATRLPISLRFSRISGLGHDLQVQRIHEGGHNAINRYLPRQVTTQNLVFERGSWRLTPSR
ncbi:hypothetical protein [Serratia rubidaea]|uniref:hypothetical protein n=1 Tax=Serratia rubidaea TaxID=61652 RepID=UPI00234A4F1E|nr:hypothetical protein [Serratia rubidaea]MDC6111871.1 hypothetical protein [Serratia rubidaea]